jgi:hypothetical protein
MNPAAGKITGRLMKILIKTILYILSLIFEEKFTRKLQRNAPGRVACFLL